MVRRRWWWKRWLYYIIIVNVSVWCSVFGATGSGRTENGDKRCWHVERVFFVDVLHFGGELCVINLWKVLWVVPVTLFCSVSNKRARARGSDMEVFFYVAPITGLDIMMVPVYIFMAWLYSNMCVEGFFVCVCLSRVCRGVYAGHVVLMNTSIMCILQIYIRIIIEQLLVSEVNIRDVVCSLYICLCAATYSTRMFGNVNKSSRFDRSRVCLALCWAQHLNVHWHEWRWWHVSGIDWVYNLECTSVFSEFSNLYTTQWNVVLFFQTGILVVFFKHINISKSFKHIAYIN